MSDPLGLLPETTSDPLGLLGKRSSFAGQELRSDPVKSSLFGDLYDTLFTDKGADRAKAANAVAISQELDIPPSVAYENMDELTKQLEMRDQPTFRDMIERPIMGGVVYGLLAHPLATVVGVTAFGVLSEAENYLAAKATGKPYEFGAGRGLADMLPEDTAQGFKDLVWTADMAWKAVAAGGAIKAAKPAAEQFAMKYMRDVSERYNLPRNVYISPEKIREFHGLGREDIITPEEAGMLKDMGLTRKDYIDGLKYGIDLEIPAEKLVTVVDKPWWATMKGLFKVSPYEETVVSRGATTGKKPVSGAIENKGPLVEGEVPGAIVPLEPSRVEGANPDQQTLKLVRIGPMDESGGNYFGIEGMTQYEGKSKYILADAKIADLADKNTADKVIDEVLKNKNLTAEEIRRLNEAKGQGDIDYLLFDETPMSQAAEKLGYDAVKVLENQDYPGSPSSVFVINKSKISPSEQETFPVDMDDPNTLLDMAARSDEVTMPAQTTEYDKLRAQAAQIAYTNLSKKIDFQKRKEAAQIRRQGMEDARQDPAYQIMQDIISQGGLNQATLLKYYDKDTVKELMQKRVGLVTKDGKVALDITADAYQLPSDDALMNMMLGWEGLKVAGEKAAAGFESRMSDLISESEKEDFHLALLEEEAKILRKMIKATGKPSTPGIKGVIREQTGQTRVEELMVSEYDALKAGMKKAEQASRAAFREGKLDGALAEKERQIEMSLNRREKLKAKQEARDIHDGILEITKDNKIPEEYRDRINELLEDYDLLPRSKKTAARVESAREFLERQKQAGEDISIPESMLNRIERYGKIHWRQMTLDQLREVFDQAKIYAHLGKLKNKLIAAKKGRDFEQVVETIVSGIEGKWGLQKVSGADIENMFVEKSRLESIGEFKDSYLASLTKVETYLKRLDGFKEMGPIWETIYLPIKQASDAEYTRLAEITTKLQELFSPMRKTLTKEKFKIPGVDQFMTKEQVIMTAMNSGNEGNLNALRENKTYQWDDAKIENILSKMTPEEWALVRGVWGMFEKQYPALNTVYKNLSGTTLKKVEGDYFPLVFDRSLSWVADRNATEKEMRDFFQSIYTLPSVKTGSTVERVGGKLPPKLKFSVIFEKLAEINHFITHAEAVRDVQKVLGDPRVRAAIEGAPQGIGGPEAYREMTRWLQDVARQQADPLTAVDSALKTARINTTTVAMAWKFSTAASQFLGATNSIYKIGSAEFAKGLAEFYTNREEMVEKVKGMSAEMSGRAKSFDRELRDAYNRIGLEHFRTSSVIKDSFFSLISFMDMAVAYPTWVGAYNKGIKDFGEETKAIEYADMIVRTSQGAGLVKDLAGVQRGSELSKWVSMFYTFFSSYHQMMSDAWVKFRLDKTGANFADLMKAWWWLTILPATIDYMIKERDVPSPGKLVANVIQQRLTAYPVIRDITGAALTDFDYQFSPVAKAGEVIGKLANEVAKIPDTDEEVDMGKLMQYGLESSGYVFGLPTGQAVVTMRGVQDLLNGETSDISRLLFRAPREEE